MREVKIAAVIFDLDGVIVTTDELHYQAWKYMADLEGIYFDTIINNRLRGVSRMESLEIILEKTTKRYSNDEKIKLAAIKNYYYVELLAKLTPSNILPGVLQLLEELKSRGIKIAIGSSSKNATLILKQIGLDKTFDKVADGNDIKNSKPAPDVFLKAAEKLEVDPKTCVVVEDAEAGVIAAKRASMSVAAVGDAKKSELADYRLDDITELVKFV